MCPVAVVLVVASFSCVLDSGTVGTTREDVLGDETVGKPMTLGVTLGDCCSGAAGTPTVGTAGTRDADATVETRGVTEGDTDETPAVKPAGAGWIALAVAGPQAGGTAPTAAAEDAGAVAVQAGAVRWTLLSCKQPDEGRAAASPSSEGHDLKACGCAARCTGGGTATAVGPELAGSMASPGGGATEDPAVRPRIGDAVRLGGEVNRIMGAQECAVPSAALPLTPMPLPAPPMALPFVDGGKLIGPTGTPKPGP